MQETVFFVKQTFGTYPPLTDYRFSWLQIYQKKRLNLIEAKKSSFARGNYGPPCTGTTIVQYVCNISIDFL